MTNRLKPSYTAISDFDPLAEPKLWLRVVCVFIGLVVARILVPEAVMRLTHDRTSATMASVLALVVVLYLIARQVVAAQWPSADSNRQRYLAFVYRVATVGFGVIVIWTAWVR